MTRGEAKFRLAFSAVGLALLAVAILTHGVPEGPGLVEVVGVTVVFFGWSAVSALRRLMRGGE